MKQQLSTLHTVGIALSAALSAMCIGNAAHAHPSHGGPLANQTLTQEGGLRAEVEGRATCADLPLVGRPNPLSADLRWALLPGQGEAGSREILVQGGEPGQRVVWTVRLPGMASDHWPVAATLLDGAGESRVTIPSPGGLMQADWGLWAQVGGTWWPGPQVSVGGSVSAAGLDATRIGDQAGGMLISEIMKNPSAVSDSAGEWIELYNPIWMRQDIDGWTLSDDGGSATILSNGGMPVWVAGRGYRALVRNLDSTANGGVTGAYRYTSFSLGNGADEVILSRPDGTVVDRVAYDDGDLWPDDAGQSMQLHPGLESPYSNDSGGNWCSSEAVFGAGDMGTPGMANLDC